MLLFKSAQKKVLAPLLDRVFTYMRAKKSHNQESSWIFAEVHVTEVGFDDVAILMIIILA